MLSEGKTFIVLIESKDCALEDYRIVDGAQNLLKNHNVPYF